ncbi:hypothetical protein [Myroides odoratimimus]|uniref:hypothetical protein n=1 Tax=Myroides odoratimimus TaxID=76832 RepID=UPI0006860E4A|nr:hypothetical protein [Myroides odoratimimus]
MMKRYKTSLEDTYDLVERTKQYDFNTCLSYILERGKKLYGEEFIINPFHKDALYKVLIYAIEDHTTLERLDLSLDKGLLIMGAPSSGKTAVMQLVKPFFSRKKQYDIKTCRSLAHDFMQRGFETTTRYENINAKPFCLDNLGKEQVAKHYGYACEVVTNIIESHYEQRFDQTYPRIHITTSLSPTEIEDRYGQHFRKMLQQLFNVIVIK